MWENHPNPSLYTEKFFCKFSNFVSRYRYVILGSLIFGFLAYTYTFTNKLPNHDDLRALFSKGTTFASGRWGLKLLSTVFPNISMPWIFGVLSLLFISADNCLIVGIFRIKSPVLQFLLGGIIISFPSQTGTFGYMFTACAYSVALCLSVAAVFFLCRGKRNYPAAAACVIFSLSIYQAYLSVTVSLLILFLIYRVLTQQNNTRQLLLDGILYVCFLIASLGLYWLSTKAVWALTGTKMGAYADGALSFSMASVVDGALNAYRYFCKILFDGYGRLIPTTLPRILHWLCLILAGIELVCFTVQNADRKRTALLLFLLAILPLGMNCILLFVTAASVHTLVFYSFTAIYVLLAVLIEYGQCRTVKGRILRQLHRLRLDGIVLSMAIIVMGNVYTANASALKLQLSYENTYSFSTSAISQLRSMPGYTADSKVAIIGTYDAPGFYRTHFSDLSGLMGTDEISPTVYSIGDFFAYYVGADLNWASAKECEAIRQSPEFAAMQSYPDFGFIRQIGDVFVIKLSE